MKIVYLGSGDIGVPSLEWLLGEPDIEVSAVVTQPDRAAAVSYTHLTLPTKA